jgi:hypothetical protein
MIAFRSFSVGFVVCPIASRSNLYFLRVKVHVLTRQGCPRMKPTGNETIVREEGEHAINHTN